MLRASGGGKGSPYNKGEARAFSVVPPSVARSIVFTAALFTCVPTVTTGALAIPDALFEHQAVLYTRDHKPFSEVDEIYRRQILAFPPPRSRQ